MKIGDKVKPIANDFPKDRNGEIVETGSEGYDWQVRFPDAMSSDDTYYFNGDELEVINP